MFQELSSEQALHLLRLRAVIARAAQKDSLRWWEDETLTTPGGYILERVFPGAPMLTGRNLTLRAAAIRHDAVIQGFDHAIHLYHISPDNSDVLAMRAMRNHFVEGVTHFPEPITTLDTLRQHLQAIIGTPPRYGRQPFLTQNGGLQIWLLRESADMVERANALAWAYLEGTVDQPVLPYMLEQA